MLKIHRHKTCFVQQRSALLAAAAAGEQNDLPLNQSHSPETFFGELARLAADWKEVPSNCHRARTRANAQQGQLFFIRYCGATKIKQARH
jgi:hypothetical protein